MAYSTVPKVRRDGQISLKSADPVTLVVEYEEGNFSFEQVKDDRIIIRDRGAISAVRKGDSQPLTGSFSFYLRSFTSSTAGSVLDFINKTNAYSGNTSTGSAGSPFVEEYCIDIEFQVDGSSVGDSAGDDIQKALFQRCICVASFSEGDPSQVTVSFECFGGISYSAS